MSDALAEYCERIQRYAREYGIFVTDTQASQMMQHVQMVIDRNRNFNLTRIDSLADSVSKHVIDSLLLLPSLTARYPADDIRFLDLGTGAGFPGIPIAIVTNNDSVLLDSVAKKVHAVQGFVDALSLRNRVSCVASRSEDLARDEPHSFDVVIARAVASLDVLLELSSPLLSSGGFLFAMKATVCDADIESASPVAELCGMEYVSRETYELPDDAGHREIVRYRKFAPASIQLPRRNGLASRKPLRDKVK